MDNDSSIAQIAAMLRDEVARSRPGDRLPSSREIMRRHGVSPVTVSRAIGLLTAEGNAVTLLTHRLTASVLLIEALGGGWNPTLFPTEPNAR